MNEISILFGTPLISSTVDLDKIKIGSTNLKRSYISQTPNNSETDLLSQESLSYLREKLASMAEETKALLNVKSYELYIQHIWLNNYLDKDYQESHVHAGNGFSFIIYYDTIKSNTVLEHPAKKEILCGQHPEEDHSIYETHFELKQQKGSIIMFPSWLSHFVKPNSDGKTIAGNINFKKILKNEKEEEKEEEDDEPKTRLEQMAKLKYDPITD